MTKIYEGDVGVEIILATGQVLTAATKTEIHVKKPDGTLVSWTATKHATAGSITYTTVAADLLVYGDYKLQAYVEWGSTSTHLGESVTLHVSRKYS